MSLVASDDCSTLPNPPRALPASFTDQDFHYSPVMDYDTDSCYNVPAVGYDSSGNIAVAQGLPLGDHSTDCCRDKSDLDNTNAYSRQRCNSGYCAYMYAYYFEKDVGADIVGDAAGHKNDWEHVIVWVKQVCLDFTHQIQVFIPTLTKVLPITTIIGYWCSGMGFCIQAQWLGK
jgi:hypothetical protein